jgi:hypothetical protein
MNFSPTLLNSFDGLANDSFCGLFFEAYYIKHEVESKPSDAMRLGQYFEFVCTGATLRDGSTPQPDLTQKKEPTAPYRNVMTQKRYWDVFAEHFGLTDKKTGVELLTEYNGKTIKGICDVVCKTIEDEVAIIDLKYTAHINNKWDNYGWGFADMGGNWGKMLQAVVYCYAYEKIHGVRPVFYFYVAASNSHERRIFKVTVTDAAIEKMLHQVDYAAEMIEYQQTTGWMPTENYLNCIECPLAETCPSVKKVPTIQHVTV